jgi:cytochrome c-type biogenesis protein CcmH
LTLFAAIAVLFTALSIGLVVWPLLRSGTGTHPLAATLTALAIPAAVVLIYLLVSEYDWRESAAAAPAQSAVSAEARSMEEAVASLERRLKDAPADEEGWILLGSSYLRLNRPAEAVTAYQRALDASGGRSVDARLGVAEARIVLDPGSLTGPVGDEIEAVLKAEPRNPKGLWYGGRLSLARGQPAVARERWTALLELSPPERVRQIIETQLAELDGPATASPSAQVAAQSAPAVGSGSSISVMVSVSDTLRAQVSPSAPLFVFVRDAENPGPPLAVIRRKAQELPVTLQISDADIMLPGRTLASVATATLVARIANGGDPIAKPGDVYGEASWQRATVPGGPVAIVIDRVVR